MANTTSALADWVLGRCEQWRSHKEGNYIEDWDRYERLWRGIWDGADSTRDTERSKIVTPMLQQAIETFSAEIDEAIFGRGEKFFDIIDDDQEPADVEIMKRQLMKDFKKDNVRKSISDVVLLAAVYGTGIGEIVVANKKELIPATQPIPGMPMASIGVIEQERVAVELRPIHPKNFLIDPNASTIPDALGCAVEEFVSIHSVVQAMEDGSFMKKDVGTSVSDEDLEAVQEDIEYQNDKVKLLRYYGLVPRVLLEKGDEASMVDLLGESDDEMNYTLAEFSDLVEAIIVIANDQHLLKAEESPYMMKDRPLVAFQNDSMPNRFWGRGVAEKGYNMQRAIDAQVRSHLDSLALTTVPMMAMDATRLPRGAKFEVRPGKTILTNGNPAEILQPFKFGNLDPNNLATAKEFERMLLQATGTIDSSAITATGNSTEGYGTNPALMAIIKKSKRTLVNFQEQFLIPFITKSAHRYMQFDPDRYPVRDFTFIPTSHLGIIAREFEQVQFINLLKTLGPDSKITPIILKAIIENSGLENREELIKQLDELSQPSEQEQQVQQQMQQMQMQAAQLELADKQADIQLKQAKAQSEMVDMQLKPAELQAKVASSASKYLSDATDPTKEFEKRVKITELALKDKDINTKREIAQLQVLSSRQK
jgi:hypothetical protein